RPSTVNAATNRSDCRVSMICTPSNIRKSAHGPSNLSPAEPVAGAGEIVARMRLLPPGPGNCTGTATWGPCEYFTSFPSTSRMNCWIEASISTGLSSSWMLGMLPPPRKRTSDHLRPLELAERRRLAHGRVLEAPRLRAGVDHRRQVLLE